MQVTKLEHATGVVIPDSVSHHPTVPCITGVVLTSIFKQIFDTKLLIPLACENTTSRITLWYNPPES